MPTPLRPTAPIARDAILLADPALAMAAAQRLTVKPLMSNHHHGLWGYFGARPDGGELTVQSLGIGAPSSTAVVEALAGLGAKRAVVVSRFRALRPDLRVGDRIVVSRSFGDLVAKPEPRLAAAAVRALERSTPPAVAATTASHDLGVRAPRELRERWLEHGVSAVDLDSAAVLGLGERLQLATAVVGLIADGDSETADEGLVRLAEAVGGAFQRGGSTAD